VTVRIQQGDSTDRLRRALGVRGPLRHELDTTVSPVVNLGDIGELPYALDPSYGAGSHAVTGGAAERSTVGIINDGPEGSAFLLETLHFSAAAIGLVEVSRSGVITGTAAPSSSVQLADTTSQARPGATGRDLPVRMVGWIIDVVTVGSLCEIIEVQALITYRLDVKHLLRKGEICYVKHLTDATRLRVSCSGRFFQQLGDTGA
jgi:hypothetical protein